MKILIPFLAGAILLAGCEQDPMKNASDSVRNGHLPDSGKLEPQKPLPKDSLQIDAPGKYNGRVNFPIEIKIAGRVLVPDIPFTFIVANLDRFPGATFDAATGVFKWTPNKEFLNGQMAVMETLEVVMKTLPGVKNYPESTETKFIPVIITNEYERPIINTIIANKVPMKAETRLAFELEDQDAVNAKDLNVVVTDCATPSYGSGKMSLGALVQVDRAAYKETSFKGKYTGELKINLNNVDNLTDGDYCLALQAVSKFGVPSLIFEKTYEVVARPRMPETTLDYSYELKTGEINQITFSVFDTSTLGRITTSKTDSLSKVLPGSSLTCSSNWGATQTCKMVINTTAVAVGRYPIEFEASNARAGVSVTKKINFDIVVK
jgi:hypothetical protein